jgi:ketosteroid isomerase-like protein
MDKIELVKRAFDLDDPDRYAYLSDDFQWTDELGSPPMDKSTWLGIGKLVESAFPDLSMVIEDIREEGDGVVVRSHLAGTFSNDLDLSSLGMGVIPATGKPIDFPSGTDLVCFDDGKISEFHNRDTGPDAGMAGFFKTMGANGS